MTHGNPSHMEIVRWCCFAVWLLVKGQLKRVLFHVSEKASFVISLIRKNRLGLSWAMFAYWFWMVLGPPVHLLGGPVEARSHCSKPFHVTSKRVFQLNGRIAVSNGGLLSLIKL